MSSALDTLTLLLRGVSEGLYVISTAVSLLQVISCHVEFSICFFIFMYVLVSFL